MEGEPLSPAPLEPARGPFVAGCLVLLAIAVVLTFGTSGGGEAGLLRVIRTTARTSCALFLGAFLTGPLVVVFPSRATRAWSRQEGSLWMSFAASHVVHLLAIVTLAVYTAGASLRDLPWLNALFGGVVYVLILTVAAMTVPGWSGRFRHPGWSRTRTVATYVVWTAFLLGFGSRAPGSSFYSILTAVPVLAMVLRLAATLRSTR